MKSISRAAKTSFKLGATSYVIPAGLAANAAFLAGVVDDVQLTLFETPAASNIPTRGEVRAIREISRERGISVSVHMPCAIDLGSADSCVRRASAEIFRRTIDATAELEPTCCVLHAAPHPVPEAQKAAWAEREAAELSRLVPMLDTPRILAFENVEPSFSLEEMLIDELDASVCIDFGHLALHGVDMEAHASRWIERCTCAHIHAAEGGRDHMSVALLPLSYILKVFEILRGASADAVLTMEVFEREDFESSLAAMRDAIRQAPRAGQDRTRMEFCDQV